VWGGGTDLEKKYIDEVEVRTLKPVAACSRPSQLDQNKEKKTDEYRKVNNIFKETRASC
jgi:hypothetical protein